MTTPKTLRTCDKGHQFYKSSDCPSCPTCEKERKPNSGFLSRLGAPAKRALENNGITTLEQLSKFTEKEILQLHGMGPSSLPKLSVALEEEGLSFRN
ncbi:RNA polymerase alpha subunit C-terminal domain-containing protein [Domibacillus sp. A3M-37]|uniref:RNA polymerase alpha subunit C-terminal domain-containing protein n=1 Tax=Domibacillus sp. A3M-37 TaxID=2962037 RepID=UPI0020B69D08|nr:RNA polymerase alpha subunit C-terminal domain-containing protein [Domibacillus sp. A3M-37]MCP3765044.1 RNA polymerase alpha subunit C-terminal domain-containing protein [Domibacillus sp. A3M-37]